VVVTMKRPGSFVVLVVGVVTAMVGAVINFLPLGFIGLGLVLLSIHMLNAEIKRKCYGPGTKRR
jgi:hypothetical protein